MHPARIALVLALALAGSLAACGLSSSPQHRSAATNRSRVISPGASYVAMGDSYTAAPFTGATAAPDGCFQSVTNYPHLVAEALGLALADVSCSGANTASITSSQQTATGVKRPPQINAVGPHTALVTVSIGANDGDVFAALSLTCLALTQSPTGAPCSKLDAAQGTADLASKIAAMRIHLTSRLEDIIERAPHARVVVVGYPDAMPRATCAQYPLATGDLAWARRNFRAIVAAQRRAADAVGAEYVDTQAATLGQDVCSADPWIAGEHPTAAAAPLHPYETEQAVVAAALEERLRPVTKP